MVKTRYYMMFAACILSSASCSIIGCMPRENKWKIKCEYKYLYTCTKTKKGDEVLKKRKEKKSRLFNRGGEYIRWWNGKVQGIGSNC